MQLHPNLRISNSSLLSALVSEVITFRSLSHGRQIPQLDYGTVFASSKPWIKMINKAVYELLALQQSSIPISSRKNDVPLDMIGLKFLKTL